MTEARLQKLQGTMLCQRMISKAPSMHNKLHPEASNRLENRKESAHLVHTTSGADVTVMFFPSYFYGCSGCSVSVH